MFLFSECLYTCIYTYVSILSGNMHTTEHQDRTDGGIVSGGVCICGCKLLLLSVQQFPLWKALYRHILNHYCTVSQQWKVVCEKLKGLKKEVSGKCHVTCHVVSFVRNVASWIAYTEVWYATNLKDPRLPFSHPV